MSKLDERNDRAKGLGIDLKELEQFSYAADRGAGLNQNKLSARYRSSKSDLGEAASEGSGEAQKAFQRLGLTVKELQLDGPVKAIEKIAARMAECQGSGRASIYRHSHVR